MADNQQSTISSKIGNQLKCVMSIFFYTNLGKNESTMSKQMKKQRAETETKGRQSTNQLSRWSTHWTTHDKKGQIEDENDLCS